MKKLLAIIVLGLLLSGNAYAEKIVDMTNSTWKDTKGWYFGPIAGDSKYTWKFFENGRCKYGSWDLWYSWNDDCSWVQEGNKVYLNINPTGTQGCLMGVISSRTISWAVVGCSSRRVTSKSKTFLSKAKFIEKYLDENIQGSSGKNIQVARKTSLTSKKDTCKDIGFKTSTDPFANCVLRLMEIEEARSISMASTDSQKEIAAAQSLIEQEIAKEGRDQEAWKVLLGLTLGSNSGSSSGSNLNLNSNTTSCIKSGETTSGTSKICYYNCMGNTKTKNVSSMSICPLNARL